MKLKKMDLVAISTASLSIFVWILYSDIEARKCAETGKMVCIGAAGIVFGMVRPIFEHIYDFLFVSALGIEFDVFYQATVFGTLGTLIILPLFFLIKQSRPVK